jgi:dihydroorotate dehydrogenase
VDIYQLALRPLLFSLLDADPEDLHQKSLQFLSAIDARPQTAKSKLLRNICQQSFCRQDDKLSQTLFGLKFPNPIGLAAGFDKDAVAVGMWQYLGFGFAEMGTVTYHEQPGNEKPRLFRLNRDRAALNRMGFNNRGSAAMAAAMAQRSRSDLTIPIGINLGKSKITPNDEAATDYVGSFQRLQAYGDYFTINVSSPNTPNLRDLQAIEPLRRIFDALDRVNTSHKPILLKIAPDLAWEDIAQVVDLVQEYRLAGIIATNTTIDKSQLQTKILKQTGKEIMTEAGGISGAPVRDKSTAVIRFIHDRTGGSLPIIGVGGIFTAEDAWEKLTAGASLLQVYTGWVYEGPWLLDRLLTGILAKLEAQNLNSIGDLQRPVKLPNL